MTGRTWPYLGMDQNAKKTRKYVLQTFWQDYVSNKNGRRDVMPANTLATPKSVFSNAMIVMDKGGWMD